MSDEMKNVSEIIEAFSGQDEDTLITTIKTALSEQIKDGTYDEAAFIDFCKTIQPVLNDGQQKKLAEIIIAIRS